MFDTAFAAIAQAVPGDDAARLGALRELEELKCVIEARQAEITAELAHGRDPREVSADVAIARRESPHRGRQHLGLAMVLTDEMPHTMAAFRQGRITEWRATLIARETACLSLEDRRAVDDELAGAPEELERMGDRQIVHAVRRLAAELDPASVVARRRRAESERTVTLRPAPDTMTYLTALVPVEQGVAAYAALVRAADSARAAGDPRGRGQVMADTLVERLTGQARASDVPVAVNLVVSDQVLLGYDDQPAHLDGHGPLPADLARQWVATAAHASLRRLYAKPTTGQLVTTDSRSRAFPAGLARLIRFRDQTCTTAWCDAPIRHTDHITPRTRGGPTSLDNGQGHCEACNQAKGTQTWSGRGGVPPSGARPWPLSSRMEIYLSDLVLTA